MIKKQAYDKLLQVRQRLIAKYNDLGLRASGRYERELQVIEYSGGVKLVAPQHGYFMEKGRSAGKPPPREVIIQWIEDKQIQYQGITKESLAYLICRKIGRDGIRVPNPYNKGGAITSVVNEQLTDEIAEELGSDIYNAIVNIIKL